MKRLISSILFLVAVVFTMSSCEMKNSSEGRYSIALNLTSWDLPDTATVSIPFNLKLSSKTEDSCTDGLKFTIATAEEYGEAHSTDSYKVYAWAIYDNRDKTCTELITYKDSTVSITLKETGKYYYYFLKDNVFNKDSIVIVP